MNGALALDISSYSQTHAEHTASNSLCSISAEDESCLLLSRVQKAGMPTEAAAHTGLRRREQGDSCGPSQPIACSQIQPATQAELQTSEQDHMTTRHVRDAMLQRACYTLHSGAA